MMFSISTMASSTSTPTTIDTDNSVTMLTVKPIKCMTPNVGITDKGKASACKADLKSTEVASEAYFAKNGAYAADIPALYAGTLRRASHFRPVADIAGIVMMVAGLLLARGMDPAGLRRSLAERRRMEEMDRP